MSSYDARSLADEILAREIAVAASPVRRLLALMALYGLGAVLIYAALLGDGSALRRVLLVGLGAVTCLGGERLRRATLNAVVLDHAGLHDSGGGTLATWDNIEKIERGAFATKPSNGFSVVLKTRAPRAWAPGLWWRIGRRVGVGGVLPGREARFMGEQMALVLAARAMGETDDEPDA